MAASCAKCIVVIVNIIFTVSKFIGVTKILSFSVVKDRSDAVQSNRKYDNVVISGTTDVIRSESRPENDVHVCRKG